MSSCIKYGLALLVCLCVLHRASANEIDRLTTKDDVRKFIEANFGEKGFFIGRCSKPVSGENVVPVIEHDTTFYRTVSEGLSTNVSFDGLERALDHEDWHYYKADIDGNGYTDMVIDAGMVIIIMDMGDGIEGQVISLGGNYNLYGFKQFIPLPDGAFAIALRHDHNPSKSTAHSNFPGRVTYITDTLASNTNALIDTLYKITRGTDSIWKYSRSGPGGTAEMVYNGEYADTADMRLYNMFDTIVYKFDGFTMYKPHFKLDRILKIDYYYKDYGTVTGWVDANSCVEINKDGKCFLQHPTHDDIYSARLDSTRLNKLWRFMSCIDIKSRKERNECVAIDGGEGATFAVYFDDGSVKKIDFWCYRMPIDLGYLGKAIADVSKILNWQPAEKNDNFECPCVLEPPVSTNDIHEGGDNNCGN